MRSRLIKSGVGLLLAAAVLATAGTWGYIHLVRDKAPERLTLDAARTPTEQTSTTTAAGDVAGTWKVAQGSQVGYRVVPGEGQEVRTTAGGRLTLSGNTRPVRIELAAQRSAASVRVAGRVPIVFAEWGIPDPSFGPAQTDDNGELEFLLVLSR